MTHFGSQPAEKMLLVNITANPCKITYDDANSFGMTRVTLSTVAYNVYDTKVWFESVVSSKFSTFNLVGLRS